jgi:3-deoxy-D-manno-octulosonic-acid transferase
MYLLYSLLLFVAFAALSPYFIYQAIRSGKYASSFRQRLGFLPEELNADSRPTLWLHAVSVGEFLAARTLIEQLRGVFAGWRIVVSTTTLTGQLLAQKDAGRLFDCAFYFPFDWTFSVRRALDRVRPRAVVIVETELWPNFVRQCDKRGVVLVLANGRISQRSFSGYRRAKRFIGRVVAGFSLLVMQSEDDARRIRLLGAPDPRVRVCGNLKYDRELAEEPRSLEDLIAPSLAALVVAGSTAPGEEEIVLSALRQVRRHPGLERTRLVIAPRHPERFSEAAALIARSGFTFARRSELGSRAAVLGASALTRNDVRQPSSLLPDIVLLDSIGELGAVYRFATVAFVGGSLVPKGGHNIVEPAGFAKPIIIGPHTDNFRQIVSDFRAENALVQLSEHSDPSTASVELANQITYLLTHADQAAAIGNRAKQILLKSRGATKCTIAAIRTIVSSGE